MNTKINQPNLKKNFLPMLVFVYIFFYGINGIPQSHASSSLKPLAEISGGLVWQTVNDVEIPYEKGTRFSIADFSQGPWLYYRLNLGLHFLQKHELFALYAPLVIKETVSLPNAVSYQNEVFAPNTQTDIYYKFNSYRLTYRYDILNNIKWNIKIGFTGKIRDAKIELSQNSKQAALANVGFVPLLHFFVGYFFTPDFSLALSADALASPYGRAEDAALKARYKWNKNVEISLGYRTVEGGSAGSSGVYTFAWLHYGEMSIKFIY